MADKDSGLDLAVKITLVVLILLIVTAIVASIVTLATAKPPSTLERLLQLTDAPTDRDDKTTVHVNLKYRLDSLKPSKIPTDASVKTLVLSYLMTSTAVPAGTTWESVCDAITEAMYDLTGVIGASAQIQYDTEQYTVHTKGYVSSITQLS